MGRKGASRGGKSAHIVKGTAEIGMCVFLLL